MRKADKPPPTTTLTATLPCLERLLCSHNALGGTIDCELLRWKLEGRLELQLSANNPGFYLPPDIGDLKSSRLVEVDLSDCSLRAGPSWKGWASWGPRWRSSCSTTTPSRARWTRTSSPSSQSLHTLSVANNRLSGPLPAGLVLLWQCLHVLRLEDNQLEGPIPAEWANLGNLEELSFGGAAVWTSSATIGSPAGSRTASSPFKLD